MLSIQKKISSYNFSNRNGNSIKYIVIHYTGNKGDTAKDNVDYFYDGDRSASAHFFVDNTSIWQSVEESNSAWAVGGGTSYGATNRNSLSIEMCCNSNGVVTDVTENNALELTKYLMNKYGVSVSNVIRHYDCNSIRKVCPNWSDNNWARWSNFKAKLSGQQVATPNPTPQPTVDTLFEKAKAYNTTKCKELQEKLNKCGYNCGTVDGVYGQLTHTALGNFQAANSLTKDFLAGTQTFSKLDEIIAKQNTNQTPVTSVKYNEKVKEIQTICNKYGMNIKVDGIYGSEAENAIKKLPLAGLPYKTPELTKWIQKTLGITQDGVFGANTDKKVREYQSKNNLKIDGLVGFSSIKSMLNL